MRFLLLLLAALPAWSAYDYVPEPYRDMFAEEVESAGMEQFAPLIAAQIRHESNWDPNARSGVGAVGLSQFMPTTWSDEAEGECIVLGPTDPRCAIRAQVTYMQGLLRFIYGSRGVTQPPTPVDAYQLALASYNAGLGNILQERRDCYGERRCRSGVWTDNVEEHCLRAERYCPETRHYVGRITNSALNSYLVQ